jgi:BRCT domain type II-containing protein
MNNNETPDRRFDKHTVSPMKTSQLFDSDDENDDENEKNNKGLARTTTTTTTTTTPVPGPHRGTRDPGCTRRKAAGTTDAAASTQTHPMNHPSSHYH